MSNLANMAVDLLCKITFRPVGGHDQDDMADVEQSWWQTLIHDLSPQERQEVVLAVQQQIEDLRAMPLASMPDHLQQQLQTLEAFVDHGLN